MDGTAPETCAECGFDSRDWRVRDAGTLFEALGYWWTLATAGLDDPDLNTRPAPGVWSALEYGLHISLVTALISDGIERILEKDGCELPAIPAPAPAGDGDGLRLEASGVLADVDREGTRLAALARRRQAAWENTGVLSGARVQAEAALLHAAHDASHHLMDVGRGLATLGLGAPAGVGSVVQVNTSDGGLPKLPVEGGRIDWRGLEGDRQANRKHHGRPFQALCLWSAEVISGLAAEGHPMAAGRAGENLTVAGLDWSSLRAGTRLRVGTALLELSFPAVPCHHQTRWFTDGDFSRISHEDNPGSARWYAWVRRPGQVAVGDKVVGAGAS